MKKFLSKFSPLLVSLMIGTLIVFLVGEVLLGLIVGFFFTKYLGDALLGYALGNLITVGRLVHMHKTTMGTIYNEESAYVQYFSGKSYAIRNGVTIMVWVCILYFLGQECMLFAILGTIFSSKVAVFTQPITDKFLNNKIFK